MKPLAAVSWEKEDCSLAGDGWAWSDAFRPTDLRAAQKRRRFSVATNCPADDDLARHGHAGIPLQRSAGLMALAEEVVLRRDSESAEFSDEWLDSLVGDLSQFND